MKKKSKRILAMIGVILLLLLYLITFIAGITSNPNSANLFKACLFATIVIPILLYAYILIYRNIKK